MPLKSNNNEMTIEELSEHEISNNGEEISKDYSDSDINYEDDINLEENDELLTEIIRDSLYEQEVSTLKDNLEYANMMGENSEGDWDKFFDGLGNFPTSENAIVRTMALLAENYEAPFRYDFLEITDKHLLIILFV